jgi:hypothetical protein
LKGSDSLGFRHIFTIYSKNTCGRRNFGYGFHVSPEELVVTEAAAKFPHPLVANGAQCFMSLFARRQELSSRQLRFALLPLRK